MSMEKNNEDPKLFLAGLAAHPDLILNLAHNIYHLKCEVENLS